MDIKAIFLPMLSVALQYWYLWAIALIFLFIKTPFFKGWIGEKILTISVKNIVKEKNGILLNNLLLPTEKDTTQVDHVLLLPSGIFVIETKNMKGWIFGDAKSRDWTQQIYKHKSKFQNPLHQNYKHVKTIESILDLDDEYVHNIVAFVGSATFKTQLPEGIYTIFKLRKFLKNQEGNNFSHEKLNEYSNILQSNKKRNTIVNNYNHVKNLKEKYNSNEICPKCSNGLVERTIKKGEKKGQTFLGCSNFPKCRYIKN
ncbi:NERD domain-containing protein [Pseudofrancisella aestuarii]|uniref:NERD domain-containing protein n=1 Tax=Pseudofrancisella aestuarii TaxID=2670347 RepID=A0ABV9TAG6_9GAMM|nr:NERD domain-containing protein [Pseudofrancisella aestuarii]